MSHDPNIEEHTRRDAGEGGAGRDGRDSPRNASPDEFGPVGAEPTQADLADEMGILREELDRSRAELEELRETIQGIRAEAEEARDKYVRARADLENVRRRSAGDIERAREAGLDQAVSSVLTVYDDLGRALQVADEDDPAKILPGVRAVRDALERNLGSLDIERVGEVGDAFDPDLHEALTTVPAPDPERAGTIADVYQAGFKRGDRLVRPARVVVYAEQD